MKLQGLTVVGGKYCLQLLSSSFPKSSLVDTSGKQPVLIIGSDVLSGIALSSATTSPGASTSKGASVVKQDFLKKFILTPVKQEPKLLSQQLVQQVISHQALGMSEITTTASKFKHSLRSEKAIEIPPKKGISLKEVSSMENHLVKAVVKRIPMINDANDPTIFPFCAPSLEQFQSWHIIKRKACEWQRAVAIKENVKKLISDAKKSTFNLKDVWTTKQIMVWCRVHVYMPYVKDKSPKTDWCDICGEVKKVIDDEGKDQTESHTTAKCKEKWLSEFGFLKLNSYSLPDDIRTKLENQKEDLQNRFQDTDDSDIDIISMEGPTQITIKSEPSGELLKPKLFMPPSEGATLIEEMCQQVGIKLNQVEVCEDVYAPVTQEMLFNAAKQFMTDLVRDSLGQAYKTRSDCRPPQEILPTDVYKPVTSSSCFELLTNKHLGVQTRSGKLIKEKKIDEEE